MRHNNTDVEGRGQHPADIWGYQPIWWDLKYDCALAIEEQINDPDRVPGFTGRTLRLCLMNHVLQPSPLEEKSKVKLELGLFEGTDDWHPQVDVDANLLLGQILRLGSPPEFDMRGSMGLLPQPFEAVLQTLLEASRTPSLRAAFDIKCDFAWDSEYRAVITGLESHLYPEEDQAADRFPRVVRI